MLSTGTHALILAGVLTLCAAASHVACIPLGPRAYRLMGAGERMARAAEAGKAKPTLITLAVSAVLVIWTLYAFSGADLIGDLPFTRFALPAISLTLLARACAFPLLRPLFPENSTRFWMVSSAICLALGALYSVGAVALWAQP